MNGEHSHKLNNESNPIDEYSITTYTSYSQCVKSLSIDVKDYIGPQVD